MQKSSLSFERFLFKVTNLERVFIDRRCTALQLKFVIAALFFYYTLII